MTDHTLHPDHHKLISLAQAALKARDDRARWQANGTNAAEEHGAACEAVWDELERQVTIQDGRIPTIEHPTVRYRRMVGQMRGEIVAHCQNAVFEALDALQHGPSLEDESDD